VTYIVDYERGEPTVVLRSTAGNVAATFDLIGMVCSSLVLGGYEVFPPPAKVASYPGAGLAGMRLFAPWAGSIRPPRLADGTPQWTLAGEQITIERERLAGVRFDQHGLPARGLIAHVPWQVLETGAGAVSAHVTAQRLVGGDPAWPFQHLLRVTAELRATTLTITTELHAGRSPVPAAFGWWPQLAVPPESKVEAAVGARWLLDGEGLPMVTGFAPRHTVPLSEHLLLRWLSGERLNELDTIDTTRPATDPPPPFKRMVIGSVDRRVTVWHETGYRSGFSARHLSPGDS